MGSISPVAAKAAEEASKQRFPYLRGFPRLHSGLLGVIRIRTANVLPPMFDTWNVSCWNMNKFFSARSAVGGRSHPPNFRGLNSLDCV
jgi:hypothetical protein